MPQAVILAAGFGSRLRPLTDDRPKALVRLGPTPILEHTLAALADAGITSVVVVTGHRQERVRDYVRGRHDLTLATAENTAYASTHSLASLLAAAPLIEGDFLLVDGDLVIEPAVVWRVLDPGTRLAIDYARARDDGAVKVATTDDRIVAIGRRLPSGVCATGRSIGLAHVDAHVADRLLAVGRQLLDAGDVTARYETAFQVLIDEGWVLEAANITGLRWIEIDDHQDLRHAESRFLAA